MIITNYTIQSIWDGTIEGVILKNDVFETGRFGQTTVKIIGIHGWLDNLNSLLPLAKQLIDRHPNYEIYLYDRAGHGFSGHIPKGFEYSNTHNMQDLRYIIQTLGWNKELFSIIGHSYGAVLGMIYAASYPEEVMCLVAIDAVVQTDILPGNFFKVHGSRIDIALKSHSKPFRTSDVGLTLEKVVELTKATRRGITDEAARLLAERSFRQDTDDKLYFTRDESLRLLTLTPLTDDLTRNMIENIKASVLFIGATTPVWPRSKKSLDLLKQHNPNFEMTLINGPHHLHMTHTDQVVDRIEEYLNEYLRKPPTIDTEI